MRKNRLSNDDLQLKSNVLVETLKQYQRIFESHHSAEMKVNLLSTNYGKLLSRINEFCDEITTYSKELENIVSENYRTHDIITVT